jgi:hypothetical protein
MGLKPTSNVTGGGGGMGGSGSNNNLSSYHRNSSGSLQGLAGAGGLGITWIEIFEKDIDEQILQSKFVNSSVIVCCPFSFV